MGKNCVWAVGAMLVGGCTAIAGLDHDYVLVDGGGGDPATSSTAAGSGGGEQATSSSMTAGSAGAPKMCSCNTFVNKGDVSECPGGLTSDAAPFHDELLDCYCVDGYGPCATPCADTLCAAPPTEPDGACADCANATHVNECESQYKACEIH
jgi:hypothetical protein